MNLLTIGCLVLGFLLGEWGLGLFNVYTIGHLKPFVAFALGWVGFIIGENLERTSIIRISGRLVALSLGQMTATFGLTAWALAAFLTRLAGWSPDTAMVFALLAAVTATATDPITAVGAMDRSRPATGPSHLLMQLATIADVFTSLLFWIVLSYAVGHLGGGSGAGNGFVLNILLHPVLGLGLGLVLSLLITPAREQREVTLLLTAAIFLVAGAGITLKVSPLIVSMFASAFVMSVKRTRGAIHDALHQLEKPVYVTFLILCGALFRPLLLGTMAVPLLIYVVARTAGKVAGISLTARLVRSGAGTGKLGLGLLSQAGLAVVLAVNIYLEVDARLGLSLVALTTAGILVNQFLGLLGIGTLKRLWPELTAGEAEGGTAKREGS
ncbi:MAG: hypothetical protein JSV00_04105 [bacterium]|nr:MAG: hypothetical protein JSV00_04105 [bacterium]